MIDWHDLKLPPINLYSLPRMDKEKQQELVQHAVDRLMARQPAFPRPDLHLPVETGVKHDQDKPRMDLLDPDALEGLAAVLAFGAKKYSAHNWRGGISWSRLLAALLRHTFSILRGELTDPESGLPHIDHVGCCWMFASHLMKRRPDLDDLYKARVDGS